MSTHNVDVTKVKSLNKGHVGENINYAVFSKAQNYGETNCLGMVMSLSQRDFPYLRGSFFFTLCIILFRSSSSCDCLFSLTNSCGHCSVEDW